MRFEERELKSYAEPVSATDLKENEIYFFLNYDDYDLLIPNLQPVVFIGRNLTPGDVEKLYFQDVDSHRRGIPYSLALSDEEDINMGDAEFFCGSETETKHVFDFETALNELMKCSLRRKKILNAG